MRRLSQENPLCQRLGCDHPLKGGRREGHFDMGMGPCKTPGCNCTSFQETDPSLMLDARRGRNGILAPFPESTWAPVPSSYVNETERRL